MKKVVFVTGTRADFGKLKSLMRDIEDDPSFELHVITTGMHMMKTYGSTYREVEREKYKHNYFVANQHFGEPMCSVLGNTISLVSRITHEIDPDLIVVHGDRLEALAGATVGALQSRLVCHVEGGERSGTVDELIRHSVSKLAHIHMVANEEAKKRLVQMGENEESIYIIGSPDLDVMNSEKLPSLEEVKDRYSIDFDNYAVSMFHPVTTEANKMGDYADNYFNGLIESEDNFISIYPNNDSGSTEIIEKLKKVSGGNIKSYPSIRFEYFLVLLKNAKYVIGNSSAGIREAPFYGVPTVNVGTRQSDRYMTDSIINTTYFQSSIVDGIGKAKKIGSIASSKWFGDGDSTQKFASAVRSDEFWSIAVQKKFVDL
jgi:UDP-N-acetylglucosamine 2-epimerase (hydrolysing)